MVTKKKDTIKYLQFQLNKHICNDVKHLFTTYNATQISTFLVTLPT